MQFDNGNQESPDLSGDSLFESVEFRNLQSGGKGITEKEFYKCTFTGCSLSRAVFTSCEFEKCVFDTCDISLLNLRDIRLTDIEFVNCKAVGVTWPAFKMPGDYSLKNCKLDNGIFMGLNLNGIQMTGCSATDIDFSDCNLTKAVFDGTDFARSRFIKANLTQADFSGAHNYTLDPNLNKLKKTIFSFPEVTALLNSFDIIIK